MFDPDQFAINEAWIACKLNDAPICTVQDGDFNVVVLMDAASGLILNMAFVPTVASEQTRDEARRSLAEAQAHKRQLPKTLYVPIGHPADNLVAEAGDTGVAVQRIPEEQLLVVIAEARDGFRERFGGSVQ